MSLRTSGANRTTRIIRKWLMLALVLALFTVSCGSSEGPDDAPVAQASNTGDDLQPSSTPVATTPPIDTPVAAVSPANTPTAVTAADTSAASVPSGNTLLLNLTPERNCADSCASSIVIVDETGEPIDSVDFGGYPRTEFAYSYRGNAVLTESNDRGMALYVVDSTSATSTKIIEFATFEFIRLLSGFRADSPWYALTHEQGDGSTQLLLADVRSSAVHRFEGVSPVRYGPSPAFQPRSFDGEEQRVAIEFADGRIEVFDTATMQSVAEVSMLAGEEMVGLSPNGAQLATRSVADQAGVRIHDLDMAQDVAVPTDGHAVGWYSDDRLLVVDEQSASLLSVRSGEMSAPIPSMRSLHSSMPSTTQWHVSELGEQVVLTNIETGEQRSAASQDDVETVDYSINGVHQTSTAWAFLGGSRGAQTLGAIFLDLESGVIEVYRDREYSGFVVDFEVAISPAGASAVVRGARVPGVLLRGGEMHEVPGGTPSFCSDGAIVFTGLEADSPFGIRSALYFSTVDEAIAGQGGIDLGPHPNLTCVS